MKANAITADSRWQTWVLYSASGAGKTRLSATAPKPLFLDSNKGLLTIANIPQFAHVRSVDVNGMDELNSAYANFSGTGSRDWRKKYTTVVFDHFDDIQGLVMDELGDRRSERDSRKDPDEAEQRDYGIMGNRLRRLLRNFKKLPCHKILICAEKDNPNDGRLQPSLIGALGRQLPYFADHTAYLRIGKKGVRYLYLDPTEDFYAKTRAWWLPPEQRKIRVDLDNFTALTELFDLIAAGPRNKKAKMRKK